MPDLGETTTRFIELFYEQKDSKAIFAANTLSNPLIFAKWEIIKQGSSPDSFAFITDITVLSIMRRDSGSGSVRFGLIKSDDGSDWSSINFISSTDAVATAKAANTLTNFNPDDRFIAIAAHNTDGSTQGEIARFLAHFILILPIGDSISRLI